MPKSKSTSEAAENTAKKTFPYRWTPERRKLLKAVANEHGITVQQMLDDALDAFTTSAKADAPTTPAAAKAQPRGRARWHDLLDEILDYNDKGAHDAVQANLLTFARLVRNLKENEVLRSATDPSKKSA